MDFAFTYLVTIPSGKWIHWEIFSNTKLSVGRDVNTSMKVLQRHQLQNQYTGKNEGLGFFTLYKAVVFIVLI